jgi:hypothetical protein
MPWNTTPKHGEQFWGLLRGFRMRELAQALELNLLKHDRVEFGRRLVGNLDEWQEQLLASDSKRILLNCSRQSGKSTMSAIIALHRAIYHPGSLVLCLAPALRQSQELFTKISGFYADLSKPSPALSDRKLALELANESRIVTLPGSEKTVRGFSGASLLLIDEASRIEDPLYHAVRPMLAVKGGDLVMMSTPYGRRGVFWEAWTEDTGWERYQVPADRVPRISPEFLDEERRSLPDFVFRQEYQCSFEDTEDQMFTLDVVQRAIRSDIKPLFEDS